MAKSKSTSRAGKKTSPIKTSKTTPPPEKTPPTKKTKKTPPQRKETPPPKKTPSLHEKTPPPKKTPSLPAKASSSVTQAPVETTHTENDEAHETTQSNKTDIPVETPVMNAVGNNGQEGNSNIITLFFCCNSTNLFPDIRPVVLCYSFLLDCISLRFQ